MAFGDRIRAFGDRVKDFLGWGNGSPSPGDPGTEEWYEEQMEEAEAEAAERTQGIKDKITDIEGRVEEIPSFEEWMAEQDVSLNDITGSDEYAGLTGLIDQLQAGPTEEDYDAGYENAARLMGLSPEEAQMLIGNLSKKMAGYEEGMTEEELADAGILDQFAGMSPEERALRERQNQSNLRMAEQRATRMVQDSLADTGSTARMLQTADAATTQINNMQLQQDASLAQEQFERQIAEFSANKETWAQMVQTNQMGVQQYIENMQQSMGMAVQGYATQINALFQENQQYLQQYETERDTMLSQINALYNAAQLELGVTQAEIDMMSELHASKVQPRLDALNDQLIQDEMGPDIGSLLFNGAQLAAGIATGNIGLIISGGIGLFS